MVTASHFSSFARSRLTLLTLLGCLCAPAHALDLQGHRGARGLAPENTLEGFALTLGQGVDTLELDIAITRDGVPVISHDPALNPDITRGADGAFLPARGPLISSLSFKELAAYDVGRIKPGTAYAQQHPDQRGIDGIRIPKLSDLFDMIRRSGNERVRFAIETKVSPLAPRDTLDVESFTLAVLAAVREAGMTHRTSILSFDWRALAVVQREAPTLETVYLTIQQPSFDNIGAGNSSPSPWTAGMRFAEYGSVPKMIKAAGGKTWSAHYRDLTAAKVQEAHALGLKVLAWTVNDEPLIRRMLDLGVDGIVSDRPDRVRSEMARRGLTLPAPSSATPN
jgi:glycerophosphoryl diester phosphodiesterase